MQYYEVYQHTPVSVETIAKFETLNLALLLVRALNTERDNFGLGEHVNYTFRTIHLTPAEDIGMIYSQQTEFMADTRDLKDEEDDE